MTRPRGRKAGIFFLILLILTLPLSYPVAVLGIIGAGLST